MKAFEDLKLSKPVLKALQEAELKTATPIQEKSFPKILSGRDMVGIAQTGTGKTLAYGLALLHTYRYSDDFNPAAIVLVPTRELVIQVVNELQMAAKYTSARIKGVYGGVTMSTQVEQLEGGMDILVATPGRLNDLVISQNIKLKRVRRLVIDEVDVMLEIGFRTQLNNIFDLLPSKMQHIMFSATMIEEVDEFIKRNFVTPQKVVIKESGTRLENIEQTAYWVKNFYTKVNLLSYLLRKKKEFTKVLVFAANKKQADKLQELLAEEFKDQTCVVHSNKSQNFRIRSLEEFESGKKRVLITTDIMSRGLDLKEISHVISMDAPTFPENYMHRIGRTGRAEQLGKSILFHTKKEEDARLEIELLMDYEIPTLDFPEEVEESHELLPEERQKVSGVHGESKKAKYQKEKGFHDKKEKNRKVNLGGPKSNMASKYKKPKTRGDKNFRQGKKNKKMW